MEVELSGDVADRIRAATVLFVDAVEGITCGIHRQRWNFDPLTVGRDGGDAGGDTQGNVVELTDLLYHDVYPWASAPRGSSIDSALSRTMSIYLEDRNGRRVVGSSGFSTPAPVTLESRRRKRVSEGGNWSHRMNRRLIRWLWMMVRAVDVLSITPTPMRAIGMRRSAKPTIFSINPFGRAGAAPPSKEDPRWRRWGLSITSGDR